jgi:molybdopterin molybdotransferase
MTFEEAIHLINGNGSPQGTENIPLILSLNRILAEDIISDSDMPPFDKSAMDGFACRKDDLSAELRIVEEIPAGKVPEKKIEKGQCARIMTGAMIPEGADHVLMKEHAEVSAGIVKALQIQDSGNICYKGEDIRAGDRILQQGKRILPADIAMLAATGNSMPVVYKIPEVAVISTGNELTEPENSPGISQIRNSNGYQLTAQVLQYGAEAHYLGIVSDSIEQLTGKISSAIDRFPLVIISGGVSVGDYDFIPQVLQELNIEIMFHGLNMKPGKHFLLGRKQNHFVAGMPGNPVSSYVIFEVLVKPLLSRLMGFRPQQTGIRLPLEIAYKRKNAGTLFFAPVNITAQGTVLPVEYHGSAHINSYTNANGIMEIPVGINSFNKGDLVNVRPV